MFRIDKHRSAVTAARNYARRQTEQRLAEYMNYDYITNTDEGCRSRMIYLDAVGAEVILNMIAMADCLPCFWHTNSVEIWYQNSPLE